MSTLTDMLKLISTGLIVGVIFLFGAIYLDERFGKDLAGLAMVSAFLMALAAPFIYSNIHRRLRKRWPAYFGPTPREEAWAGFISNPPRPGFLIGVRALLWALFGLVLVFYIPHVIHDAQAIYRSTPPGQFRNTALRELIAKAAQLLGFLLMLIAAWGYGIFPRPGLTFPGYAALDWRTSKRKRKDASSSRGKKD